MEELDGMAALTDGVVNQRWPHTTDAKVWAEEWAKTLAEHPTIATDPGAMIGWFANAIMAGHDTAMIAKAKPLTWTTEKPTKPGMWWWRSSDKQSQWIEDIDLRDGRLASIGTAGHVFIDGEYDGEWSSEPIAEPEEAR